ncbi:hypothetical protein DAI22_08g192800 [Oryza sativa Japonica Group]|nr:hypothetical protein DAI22_08g192800 [Oryza sativa Japonica Group]
MGLYCPQPTRRAQGPTPASLSTIRDVAVAWLASPVSSPPCDRSPPPLPPPLLPPVRLPWARAALSAAISPCSAASIPALGKGRLVLSLYRFPTGMIQTVPKLLLDGCWIRRNDTCY